MGSDGEACNRRKWEGDVKKPANNDPCLRVGDLRTPC